MKSGSYDLKEKGEMQKKKCCARHSLFIFSYDSVVEYEHYI